MKKLFISLLLFCYPFCSQAQNLPSKLAVAFNKLQTDTQCAHALIGCYVVDQASGEVLFSNLSNAGLAPASCQKVLTSITSFALLGSTFQFETQIAYSGQIANGVLKGSLFIQSAGDPSLGSWRWKTTSEFAIYNQIIAALKKAGVNQVTGGLVFYRPNYTSNPLPGGWTWEDMGNYYGAGDYGFNWRENQFDIQLIPESNIGGSVKLGTIKPTLTKVKLENELRTAAPETGDESYVYLAPGSKNGVIRGTIPISKTMEISGAIPDPYQVFQDGFYNYAKQQGIQFSNIPYDVLQGQQLKSNQPLQRLITIQSPTIDSLNYWFLKKSINLYGEIFLRAIAKKTSGNADTESGINALQGFYKKVGIDPLAIAIADGSGLSPANRVTAQSLVQALRWAKLQSWFPAFYQALPIVNGIHMKDGYISGVRSYCGYIKNETGKEFCFAIIINNFNGGAGSIREKIWKFLDQLK
ncbi:MAG: D-alanyl-D-alanine carboxypeptidase/D-alanyl-D-alanine-endopeptidase [Bacteroidota bacterium]